MAQFTVTGKDGKPFPSKCRVRIESMPTRTLIADTVASRSYTLDLDPGKYVYVIDKKDKVTGGYRYQEERLHECTEAVYRRLAHAEPKNARLRQTTEGTVWFCGFPTCSETFTHRLAILKHEGEHVGIDIFKDPDAIHEVAEALPAIKKTNETVRSNQARL